MSRSISDINAKIAYLTNKRTGPLLKIKDPLVISNKVPGIRFQRSEDPCKTELNELLECVSQHNHNSECAKQFAALVKCNSTKMADTKEKLAKLLKGEKVDGRYHPRILETLIKRNPEKISKQGQYTKRNLLNALPEARRKPVPFEDKGRPFNKRT